MVGFPAQNCEWLKIQDKLLQWGQDMINKISKIIQFRAWETFQAPAELSFLPKPEILHRHICIMKRSWGKTWGPLGIYGRRKKRPSALLLFHLLLFIGKRGNHQAYCFLHYTAWFLASQCAFFWSGIVLLPSPKRSLPTGRTIFTYAISLFYSFLFQLTFLLLSINKL